MEKSPEMYWNHW